MEEVFALCRIEGRSCSQLCRDIYEVRSSDSSRPFDPPPFGESRSFHAYADSTVADTPSLSPWHHIHTWERADQIKRTTWGHQFVDRMCMLIYSDTNVALKGHSVGRVFLPLAHCLATPLLLIIISLSVSQGCFVLSCLVLWHPVAAATLFPLLSS